MDFSMQQFDTMQVKSLFHTKMKLLFPAAGWLFMQMFASTVAESEESKQKVLTATNFSAAIAKNNHFVLFFAPWCSYCQKLEPTWEELADMLNEEHGQSRVTIAKVDCVNDSTLCSKHDVTGYPTLKFFKQGSDEGTKFRGTRDLPTLSTFINEQMNDESKVESASETSSAEPINGLFELTDDNFDKHIASGSHFIKFYAPWCGHCQTLAPTWNSLAKSLESEKKVKIAKIDCTVHDSVCVNFEIRSYPTLLWIEDGKKVEKYSGSRSLEELQAYVTKMLNSISEPSKEGEEAEDAVPDDSNPVLALSTSDFAEGIEKGITFVKFFAPWCGHCKRLAPTWDELGKKFSKNSRIQIAKVDCTLSNSKTLCNEEEVEGFPSLFLYIDGKKVSEYNGHRSLEDLYNFVIKHDVQHEEL